MLNRSLDYRKGLLTHILTPKCNSTLLSHTLPTLQYYGYRTFRHSRCLVYLPTVYYLKIHWVTLLKLSAKQEGKSASSDEPDDAVAIRINRYKEPNTSDYATNRTRGENAWIDARYIYM